MLSQSFYLFLAKVFGYGLRILLPVFLVRILTKADVGAYSQFFLLEVLIQTIFQMGVNQSLYFFIPRDEKNSGAYFLNSLLLNIGLYTIAYIFVYLLRFQIAEQLGMEIIHRFFWQLACYTVLMMLNVSAESFMVARKKIFASSLFIMVRQVLASIATLWAAYFYRDLEVIFLALVISRLVSLVLGMLYIHFRLHGFRADRYFFGVGKQIRYGLLLGLAGSIWTIVQRLNEFTVSRYFDIETYAIFAQGCKQIPFLMFFSQSIMSVSLGEFARLEKAGDWTAIRELWNRILGSMYAVGIPITLFMVLLAEPIVVLMFTEQYIAAVPVFQLNNIALLSLLLNPTLVLRAMDRNDVTLKVHLLVLFTMPPTLYLGMKTWGLMGIMFVHVFFLIGGRVFTHAILNRLAPVHMPFVAPRRDVMLFYRESWGKITNMGGRFLKR
jgi:O-antigen/teichoic acid export membrane protein